MEYLSGLNMMKWTFIFHSEKSSYFYDEKGDFISMKRIKEKKPYHYKPHRDSNGDYSNNYYYKQEIEFGE